MSKFPRWYLPAAILFPLLGYSTPALAERWVPISTGDTEVRHFLDLDSITRRDNFVFFWVETIGYDEQELPIFLTRSRIGADCVQRIWRFQEQYEARDGEIITIHEYGSEGPVNILAPGNPRSAVLDFVCEGAPMDVTLEANVIADAPSERLLLAEPNISCADFGDEASARAAFSSRVGSNPGVASDQPIRACINLVEW